MIPLLRILKFRIGLFWATNQESLAENVSDTKLTRLTMIYKEIFPATQEWRL